MLQGILDTLEANKTLGVINVGMKLGARTLEPKSGQALKAYTGIDSFYDREYEYDSGGRFTEVRLRKFFGLGSGRLVTSTQLRALWRQDFDASAVDPERMRPESSTGDAAAKVKRSHEHNLQHLQLKRFRKEQREARKAAEALAVLEEELQHSLRVSTFSCKHEGCRHRPFLTQAGADAHANTCEFSGAGKRLPNQCLVKLRVRPRRAEEKLVTLTLRNSSGAVTSSLTVARDVSTTLKVLRPLAPDKPYGLQEHRALVHNRTEAAQQCAACTEISARVGLVLKVGLDGHGAPRVESSLDLKAFKRPPLLEHGWAVRPPQERTRRSAEQRSFLVELYDWPHGRLNEHQAYEEFRKKFSADDGLYARRLRLSRAQIKAFFSTEKARRIKAGAAAVVGAAVDSGATAPAPTPAPAAPAPAPAPTPAPAAPVPAPAPAPAPAATSAASATAATSDLDYLLVDDILDTRWRNGRRQFLVVWEGDDEADAVWEMEHQLPLHAAPQIKQLLWLRAGDIDESDASASASESEGDLDQEEAPVAEEAPAAPPPQAPAAKRPRRVSATGAATRWSGQDEAPAAAEKAPKGKRKAAAAPPAPSQGKRKAAAPAAASKKRKR